MLKPLLIGAGVSAGCLGLAWAVFGFRVAVFGLIATLGAGALTWIRVSHEHEQTP